VLTLPPPIRAWLQERITTVWSDPQPALDQLPTAMPAGEVQRLAGGGPFGLCFDGRLDRIEDRLALEVLENSRMAGEVYFRIWDDGTVEPLDPSPRLGYGVSKDATAEEREQVEQAYFAHNRSAYAHLRERGFLA
jgi:hypothetical protein